MAKPKKSAVSFKNRLETTFKTMPSETLRVGFSELNMWVGMGNYAMNRINSGRFDYAWLFGRNYVLYGESGSGKSLMAALIAAEAQRKHNALVIWMDIEKATDDDAGKRWLQRAGVDLDNLVYVSAAGLEEIKRTIAEVAAEVRKNYGVEGGQDVQPVVIVVDSWAAAQPASALERTVKGELVGDQGQKAKQTGEVILSTTHLSSGIPLMVIGIQHIQDNQDGFGRKHKTTGGNKMIFYASGCMLYTKNELRMEDIQDQENLEKYRSVYEDWSTNLKKDIGQNHKKGDIVGISITVECLKSRVAKPFQKIDVQVPFKYGMDKYSGLFELMLMEQQIAVDGPGYFTYVDPDVAPHKDTGKRTVRFTKKEFRQHADRIMALAPADVSDPDANKKMEPADDLSVFESATTEELAEVMSTPGIKNLRKRAAKAARNLADKLDPDADDVEAAKTLMEVELPESAGETFVRRDAS